MSILVTPANSEATAQAKDKRDALTLVTGACRDLPWQSSACAC